MDASAPARMAPSGVRRFASPRLRLASDAHLVTLIREGRPAAFEAAYDRHQPAILSFCRHMLGDRDEAEDALQHTFMAAYTDLVGSSKPIQLRPWLFAIARNRCYTVLRGRREQPEGPPASAVTEGLAAEVLRRQDLRDLVLDIGRLPAEQRAALVLAELDAFSHQEISTVLGVPTPKVKALIFQARESLVASRAARETDCAEIREQLATARGGVLRRGHLRRHLRQCPACTEFRQTVERQRRQLALVLPVVPTLLLRETVLGATVGTSAGAAGMIGGGGLLLSSALKGTAVKLVVGGAIAGTRELAAPGGARPGQRPRSWGHGEARCRRRPARPRGGVAPDAVLLRGRPDPADRRSDVARDSGPAVTVAAGRPRARPGERDRAARAGPGRPGAITAGSGGGRDAGNERARGFPRRLGPRPPHVAWGHRSRASPDARCRSGDRSGPGGAQQPRRRHGHVPRERSRARLRLRRRPAGRRRAGRRRRRARPGPRRRPSRLNPAPRPNVEPARPPLSGSDTF